MTLKDDLIAANAHYMVYDAKLRQVVVYRVVDIMDDGTLLSDVTGHFNPGSGKIEVPPTEQEPV